MSRYIDAEKIVYAWQIDADGEEHDGVTLQSIINKLPTIDAVPKWIPVTERLPEPYQYVLRTVKRLVWDEGTGYATCLDVDIGTYNTNDGSIVAWMPLPKPYEKERKEE